MRSKEVADILRAVLDGPHYYCEHCGQFVQGPQVSYGSYGNPAYHYDLSARVGCGNDLTASYIIDAHQDMLRQALEACEADIDGEP